VELSSSSAPSKTEATVTATIAEVEALPPVADELPHERPGWIMAANVSWVDTLVEQHLAAVRGGQPRRAYAAPSPDRFILLACRQLAAVSDRSVGLVPAAGNE